MHPRYGHQAESRAATRALRDRRIHPLRRAARRSAIAHGPPATADLAAQTAGVLNVTRAAGEAGLERTTAADYVKLLEAVFLIMRLPAWGTTVRARATSAPKIHVVDAGLAARLLGLTPEKLARRDPSSLSQFGHLLETFVVGELVRQASWLEGIAALGHWRTYDDDEIDLAIERDDGGVLAFEVKAAGQVAGRDASTPPLPAAQLAVSSLDGDCGRRIWTDIQLGRPQRGAGGTQRAAPIARGPACECSREPGSVALDGGLVGDPSA